jgi:hypothetical protein
MDDDATHCESVRFVVVVRARASRDAVKMRTAARRMMTIVDVSHLVTPRQIQKKMLSRTHFDTTPRRPDRSSRTREGRARGKQREVRESSAMAPKKKTPAAPVNDEEEELLDFEDAVGAEETNDDAGAADGGENGDAGANKTAVKGDGQGKNGDAVTKKGYVGIHSTGFRDFLLKPELLRAIVDCGFEHPSEGTNIVVDARELRVCANVMRTLMLLCARGERPPMGVDGGFWMNFGLERDESGY